MKYAKSILIATAGLSLAGCASTVTLLEPVGPVPASRGEPSQVGSLQVYPAVDYYRTDTEYTIYAPDGNVFKQISNDMSDRKPELVTLPVGHYKIEAQTRMRGLMYNVVLPVEIKPGQSTVAHLDGIWPYRNDVKDAEVVCLPDGQIVGWRAE